jgi:ethanolamine utilization protein EutQ (cupin superfamily)
MPTLIEKPSRVEAVGNKPKLIDEFVGRASTRETGISIAQMHSPAGWLEPGQAPEFDEYTIVLEGMLRVEHDGGAIEVHAGQAVVTRRGEWVRYSTPGASGAVYIAVCVPAFSVETVHRDP